MLVNRLQQDVSQLVLRRVRDEAAGRPRPKQKEENKQTGCPRKEEERKEEERERDFEGDHSAPSQGRSQALRM